MKGNKGARFILCEVGTEETESVDFQRSQMKLTQGLVAKSGKFETGKPEGVQKKHSDPKGTKIVRLPRQGTSMM